MFKSLKFREMNRPDRALKDLCKGIFSSYEEHENYFPVYKTLAGCLE